jgi:hypothetical protein
MNGGRRPAFIIAYANNVSDMVKMLSHAGTAHTLALFGSSEVI